MEKDDIELPPLPDTFAWAMVDEELAEAVQEYARAAIESDRQCRSEPVGYVHPANEHRLYSGETVAFRQRPYDGEKKIPVYLSPQPTEESFCEECGDGLVVEDPGICGTCYQTKYVSPQTADTVMAWRVGRELFHTEEEARANVRNPDLNPIPLCDCERGHNGMGMTGRKCDCGAPQPADPDAEPVKVPSDDDLACLFEEVFGEHWKTGQKTYQFARLVLARYGTNAPTASEISEVIRDVTGCHDIKRGDQSLVVSLSFLFDKYRKSDPKFGEEE